MKILIIVFLLIIKFKLFFKKIKKLKSKVKKKKQKLLQIKKLYKIIFSL
jgi:hypothetical protein